MQARQSETDVSSPDISQLENDEDSSHKSASQCLKGCLHDNLFMILVLLGVIVGFGFGIGAGYIEDKEIPQVWIQMPGDLYIRLLELTILPLIASNLIIVISKIDLKEQGRNSILCFTAILMFNIGSAALGTVFAAIIQPGVREKFNGVMGDATGLEPTTSDVFQNLLLNIFPNNIVGMTIFQAATSYTIENVNGTEIKVRHQGTTQQTNMIGVLFVSITFGLAARVAGEKGRVFLDFFRALAEVVLVLMRWFLLLTPIGVCFMIAGAVMKVEDITGTFADLGFFIATVLIGSVVNHIITFIIFFAVTRRNPFKFIKYCMKAWIVAFATTSPIVSIPEMYNGLDEYGVEPEVSRFVCPVITTLKADGPAIYISCAAMFVAQMSLGTLPAGTVVVIWLLTSVAVLAIPHIPSASIVISMTIMSSAGVPTQSASLLYAIDWFLDRVRSVVTVLSTLYGVVMINWDANQRSKHQSERKDDSSILSV